jgi:hypothetical protein
MTSPFGFHPVPINLTPEVWTQTLHTQRSPGFRVRSRLDTQFGRFMLWGVGDISQVYFELGFVRGDHDWNIPNAPTGYIGFLGYHQSRPSDEFGESPQFVGGGCSLPPDIYDDIWHRIKSSIDLSSSSMVLQVGPVDFDSDDVAWDRDTNKFLFITEIDFVFVRRVKEPLN